MNKVVTAMHDATHLVPGVPEHSDAQPTRANAHQRGNTTPMRDHGLRHQTPPRILVGWQEWVGRLFSRGDSR
jgi:hypothetical protein